MSNKIATPQAIDGGQPVQGRENTTPGSEADPIVYRSKPVAAIIFGGIFVVTGLILVGLAFVLGPEDREAMSGVHAVLFSVVPIKLFCWIFAFVFVALGAAVIYGGLKAKPALVLSEHGLTLQDGEVIPLARVKAVHVTGKYKDTLKLELTPPEGAKPVAQPTSKLRSRLLPRRDPHAIEINAFALGADPAKVKAELEKRLPAKA